MISEPIRAVFRALASVMRAVFDEELIRRCQQHKMQDVRHQWPVRLKNLAGMRIRAAHYAKSANVPLR